MVGRSVLAAGVLAVFASTNSSAAAQERSPRAAIAALQAAAQAGDGPSFLAGLDAASRAVLERSARSHDRLEAADRQFASAFAERFGGPIASAPQRSFMERFLEDLAGLEVLSVTEHGGRAEATVRTVHHTIAVGVRPEQIGQSALAAGGVGATKERVSEWDVVHLLQQGGSWRVALPYATATQAKATRTDRAAAALAAAAAALRDGRIPDEPSALTARRDALRLLSAAPSTSG